MDAEIAPVDRPCDPHGPAGLRGPDPDPRRGGGDSPSLHGSCNISAQSNDTGGRAGGDPWSQCRDHGVTSQRADCGGHGETEHDCWRVRESLEATDRIAEERGLAGYTLADFCDDMLT